MSHMKSIEMCFSGMTGTSPQQITDEVLSKLNLHYPYISYPYLHTAKRATPYLDIAEYRRDTLGLFRYIRDRAGDRSKPRTSEPIHPKIISNFAQKETTSDIELTYRMFIMGSMDDETVEGIDERGRAFSKRGTHTSLFPEFLRTHLYSDNFADFIGTTGRNIEELGLEICMISPSDGLKWGRTPYHAAMLKQYATTFKQGEDTYSRYMDYVFEDYSMVFKYIRFRWFYTPWIHREVERIDGKILGLDGEEKREDIQSHIKYTSTKFITKSIGEPSTSTSTLTSGTGTGTVLRPPEGAKEVLLCEYTNPETGENYKEIGLIINDVLDKETLEIAMTEYATNDDILFASAFSELCRLFMEQHAHHQIRVLTFNYAIFLMFPMVPQRFISNWSAIRGTNVIHYAPDVYYYMDVGGMKRVWWMDRPDEDTMDIGRGRCIKRGRNELEFKDMVLKNTGMCILGIQYLPW